jgi:hypothetical protein
VTIVVPQSATPQPPPQSAQPDDTAYEPHPESQAPQPESQAGAQLDSQAGAQQELLRYIPAAAGSARLTASRATAGARLVSLFNISASSNQKKIQTNIGNLRCPPRPRRN